MASGCGYLIAEKSFVCHTTPHFDSTLREVSYSVRNYHTRYSSKSKYFFCKSRAPGVNPVLWIYKLLPTTSAKAFPLGQDCSNRQAQHRKSSYSR